MKFAEWAKMYAALIGLIGTGVIGLQDMPASWKLPLEIVVVVTGAFAVWKVENRSDDDNPPPVHWASQGPAWDEPAEPEDEDKSLGRVIMLPTEPPQYRLIAA